jgi:F0F1-type ATP synthase membrane subunit c/vacuolar-type H+-ATPase subunit K
MENIYKNSGNIAYMMPTNMTPAIVEGGRDFNMNRIDLALTNKCQLMLMHELTRLTLLSKKCKIYELLAIAYSSGEEDAVQQLHEHAEHTLQESLKVENAHNELFIYSRKVVSAISALAESIANKTDELEHMLSGVVSFVDMKKTTDSKTAELHLQILCESATANRMKGMLSRMQHLTHVTTFENKQASMLRSGAGALGASVDETQRILNELNLGQYTSTAEQTIPLTIPQDTASNKSSIVGTSDALLGLYTNVGIIDSLCSHSLNDIAEPRIRRKMEQTRDRLVRVISSTSDHYDRKNLNERKQILIDAANAFIETTNLMTWYLNYYYRKGERFIERKMANKDLNVDAGDIVNTHEEFEKNFETEKEYMWFHNMENGTPIYYTSNEAANYISFAKAEAKKNDKDIFKIDTVEYTNRKRFQMYSVKDEKIRDMTEAEVERNLLAVSSLLDFQRSSYRNHLDMLYLVIKNVTLLGNGSWLHYSDSDYYGMTANAARAVIFMYFARAVQSDNMAQLFTVFADKFYAWLGTTVNQTPNTDVVPNPWGTPLGTFYTYLTYGFIMFASGIFVMTVASKLIDMVFKTSAYITLRSIALVGSAFKLTLKVITFVISLINLVSSVVTRYAIPLATLSEFVSILYIADSTDKAKLALLSISIAMLSTIFFSVMLNLAEKNSYYRSLLDFVNVIRKIIYQIIRFLEPEQKSHYYYPIRQWLLELLDARKIVRHAFDLVSWGFLYMGSVTGFYKKAKSENPPDIRKSFFPFLNWGEQTTTESDSMQDSDLSTFYKWLLATRSPWSFIVEKRALSGLTWTDMLIWFGGLITNRILGPLLPLWISSIFVTGDPHHIPSTDSPLNKPLDEALKSDIVKESTTPNQNAEYSIMDVAHQIQKNTQDVAKFISKIRTACDTSQNQDVAGEIQKQFDAIKKTLETTVFEGNITMLDKLISQVGCTKEAADKVLWWAYLFFPDELNEILKDNTKITDFPNAIAFTKPLFLHSDSAYNIVLDQMRIFMQTMFGTDFSNAEKSALCSNPFAAIINKCGISSDKYTTDITTDKGPDKYKTTTTLIDAVTKTTNKVLSILKINYGNSTIFGESKKTDGQQTGVIANLIHIASYLGSYIPSGWWKNEDSKHCHGKGRSYTVQGAHGLHKVNSEEADSARDLGDCNSEISLFRDGRPAIPVEYMQQQVFRNALKEMLRDLSLRMYKTKFNEIALRRVTIEDIVNAAESMPTNAERPQPISNTAEEVFRIATEKYCSSSAQACTESEDEEEIDRSLNGEVCVKIGDFPLWNNGLQRVEAFPDIVGYGREKLAHDTFENIFYFLLMELVVSYANARLQTRLLTRPQGRQQQ